MSPRLVRGPRVTDDAIKELALTRAPLWKYCAIAALLVAVQIGALRGLGQPLLSASGKILLWVNNPLSPETSQQLADWYSFTHIVHGIIFYGLLRLAAPRLPVAARLLLAMGLEVSWEIFENTSFMIHAYRQQALAVGYSGDSILNSVSDTLMMASGFLLASRLPAGITLALALGLELFTGVMIHDNLTLNLLNFVVTIPAIQQWQAGYSL